MTVVWSCALRWNNGLVFVMSASAQQGEVESGTRRKVKRLLSFQRYCHASRLLRGLVPHTPGSLHLLDDDYLGQAGVRTHTHKKQKDSKVSPGLCDTYGLHADQFWQLFFFLLNSICFQKWAHGTLTFSSLIVLRMVRWLVNIIHLLNLYHTTPLFYLCYLLYVVMLFTYHLFSFSAPR